jgi:formylglycine-generating enzyme required for sulfatase activity
VFRGGAWATYASDARSASRSFSDVQGRTYWLGFRLAKTTMETPPTPPIITTTSLPWGTVGQSYHVPVAAAGGTTPYTWTISSGSTPSGLDIDSSTGVISGTPTTAGTSTFSVRVTDAYSLSDTQSLSITIDAPDTLGLGIGFGPEQFALIPAGTFQMGDMVGSGYSDELPVHTVNLTHAFYLQKTEVTQAQWRAVMGSNPSYFNHCGETCPVEDVSWNDIQAFLAGLNAMDPGKSYRLPTEAEWEYAARAGTTGDYGGTGVPDEMGWYEENSGDFPRPVARKQPNDWGLFDMHGNVFEWVQDRYSDVYYSVSPTNDPTGPSTGSLRVDRGGAWDFPAFVARSAFRRGGLPQGKGDDLGFRLARTP